MTFCVYDNPSTMAREAYQDGELVAAITAELLATASFKGGNWFPMYLNKGPFDSGRCSGNPDAMQS
jgi:hypothetical protein